MKNRNMLASRRAQAESGALRTGVQTDWTRLEKGVCVNITTTSGERFVGVIGQVTPDGIVMWLHLGGGNRRKLFIFSHVHKTSVRASTSWDLNTAGEAKALASV